MTTAVLDANVILSGLASLDKPTSKPAQILRRWFQGDVTVVLSEHVLGEIRDALSAKRYFRERVPELEREPVVANMRELARLVDLMDIPTGVAPHRHDDPVLALVAVSKADYFVTGDAALLALGSYFGVRFIDPAGLLRTLDADPKP